MNHLKVPVGGATNREGIDEEDSTEPLPIRTRKRAYVQVSLRAVGCMLLYRSTKTIGATLWVILEHYLQAYHGQPPMADLSLAVSENVYILAPRARPLLRKATKLLHRGVSPSLWSFHVSGPSSR